MFGAGIKEVMICTVKKADTTTSVRLNDANGAIMAKVKCCEIEESWLASPLGKPSKAV